ncbi:Bbp16 family capsid cement protein [Sulfuricurvum sp.]|uniref:Bbp16 family capsid cement protein n=1 Tax=Sulfuricurvum sp. TaxID=2025608 RepID=UPI00356A369D
MILDDLLKLADAQESTVSVASTSYIDTIAAGDSYEGAWLHVRVDTAITASGSATVNFALQTDDDSTFPSATTLVETGAVAKAVLVAGKEYKIRIPPGAERYLRGYVTIASGPLLTGKWDMFIVKDVDMGGQQLA